MIPERDPEIASVDLRRQSAGWALERADRLHLWWSAMARSHAALDKHVYTSGMEDLIPAKRSRASDPERRSQRES